jgi:putative intracellular protease/amidase
VRATSGLTVVTASLPDPAEPLDTMIVTGGHGVMWVADDPIPAVQRAMELCRAILRSRWDILLAVAGHHDPHA